MNATHDMFMRVTIPGPTRQSFTASQGARTGLRNFASIVCSEPVDGSHMDHVHCQNSQYFHQYQYTRSQAHCQYSQYPASTSTSESSILPVFPVCSQCQSPASRVQTTFQHTKNDAKCRPGPANKARCPAVGFATAFGGAFLRSPGRNYPLQSRNHPGCARPQSTPCTGSTPPR